MSREDILNQVQTLLDSQAPISEPDIQQLAGLLIEKGQEELTYLLLQLMRQIQELKNHDSSGPSPSTPSGMIPPFQKASAQVGKKQNKKKPGGQKGHAGTCRPRPDRIDRREEHRLECCPECGGPLQRCQRENSVRSRIIEDIPAGIQPEVTEHILYRDYCPRCQKLVEPKVEAALPKTSIGHRLLVLTAYWHYALGLTTSQILDTLNYHLQFSLSKGCMVKNWHRLRLILQVWYEALAAEIQQSAVLHGDETGWRVNGSTHWLWCFTNENTTFYWVDRSRGSPALNRIFQEVFEGILVTDFWAAYDAILGGEHQCCLFHLLNELAKVDQRNASEEWAAFRKKTKRLIQDALRLRAREDFSPEKYASRIDRLYQRLVELALETQKDPDARRLANRLHKYRDELFVFLTHPEVPATNNHAEREVRFAVMIRKIIYGNRSENGALTQSVLMTVFRTLKRRGYNPIQTLVAALQEYVRTGQLPPFPPAITSPA
jgi:transposase